MTTKVQAFNLGLCGGWNNRSWRWDDCSQRFVGDDFAQLRNLRLLKLGWADLDGDFKQHLSNLRWLEWKCPANFLPNNCHLKNLRILNLRGSHITDDWKGWSEIKMAKELRILNLSRCNDLKRGPVFSEFTTLEILCLSFCDSLEEIDPSIRYLTNLRVLDISNSWRLRTFDCSHFSALEDLNLSNCISLRILDCFEHLESLRYMDMRECLDLKTLPDLSNFKKLEKLQLGECSDLIEIQGLDMLKYLELLDMGSCKDIKRLPSLSNLRMLKTLSLCLCKKLLEVDGLEGLESLEELNMNGCESIERLPNLSNLGKLKKLYVLDCKKLDLSFLESLDRSDLSVCISLDRDIKHLKLRNLNFLGT